MRNPSNLLVTALLASVAGLSFVVSIAGPASALTVERFLSNDNHVYMVVRSGSTRIQVTSVSMSAGDAIACGEPPGTVDPGETADVLTTLAAGPLAPLSNRMRTTVLSGFNDNSTFAFDPAGAGGKGVLFLPPVGGLRTVSADPGSSTEPLVSVTTADSAVPAAVDVNVSRAIPGPITCSGNSYGVPEPCGSTCSGAG